MNSIKMLLNEIEIKEKAFQDKITGRNGKKTIQVCGGTGCLASEAHSIKEKLIELINMHNLQDKVEINHVGCFGFCSEGPFVKILPDNTLYRLVKISDVEEIILSDIIGGCVIERLLYVDPITNQKIRKQEDIPFYKKQVRYALHGCAIINPEDLNEAFGSGAFKGLINALNMTSKEVIDEINASGLRGRGGGGFPTGRKWDIAASQINDTKYVICNGDEGDPGAFMDRSILEGNPFAVIEGMMIAGYAIGANNGYFYVRAEYPVAIQRLEIAIKQMKEHGLLGNNILGTSFSFDVHLRLGAGAFVCGEETALIASIEGRRGNPTPRPPYPAVEGLWGKPTIINNVETLANVQNILREGAKSFNRYGTDKSKGTKVFAIGGKVNNIGLVEVPFGTTLRELIFDCGGGIPKGKKFKAIQTGGPSGGCLTEAELDIPIDFETLGKAGSMVGSGGAIVMDEDNCTVDVAKFYLEFICDESCGKCGPCRVGTRLLLDIIKRITDGKGTLSDLDRLKELASDIKETALCGLGISAPNPVLSTMAKFYDEYVEHVVEKKCRAHVCRKLLTYYINADLCKKCSKCAQFCPVNCISGVPGKQTYIIDSSKCIKCGSCRRGCPFKAIELR